MQSAGTLMLQHSLPVVAVCLLGAFFSGCLSSSPRYRTDESPAIAADSEDVVRFAPRIKEEESREDDKKVDLRSFSGRVATRQDSTSFTNLTPAGVDRDRVLLDVINHLGVPYAFGGSTRNGMDCSAFTSTIYINTLKRQIPRSTRDQYRVGTGVSKSDLQFGDLVFFNTTGRTPSHVGIYIEDDLFAHASVTYGVTISSLESTYYKKRFVGARRVMDGATSEAR
jgi:cell wall-associated NlpC family hydrolase